MTSTMRVQVESDNGATVKVAPHDDIPQRRYEEIVGQAPSRMLGRLLFGLKVLLALAFAPIGAESLRLFAPFMGWKWYHVLWFLNYIPVVRRFDTALLFSFGVLAIALWLWNKVLRQILGVDQVADKWYRNNEVVFRSILAAVLLICDCGLVYVGTCAMRWNGPRFSPAALPVTVTYACLMVGVSYASIDTKRAAMRAKKIAVAAVLLLGCLSLAGCTPPDEQVLGQRQSEFVLTILLDLSKSFDPQLSDGAVWDWLERVLDRYFNHRAGSSEDLIILTKVSGDHRTEVWRGTPRDLREQFTSPSFRAFVMRHRGPGGSRINRAMCDSLRWIMADPNVANGTAKSALFVLSDLIEESDDGQASEDDVMRLLTEYGAKRGVVGLYFCDEDFEDLWNERLSKAGVRHVVSTAADRNPPLPSFE